jgi:CcmD family protein
VDSAGYVLAGYLVTGAALGGYVLYLFSRARRARRLAEAVAARRDDRS